jgi:quinol monooxygenase YgiN
MIVSFVDRRHSARCRKTALAILTPGEAQGKGVSRINQFAHLSGRADEGQPASTRKESAMIHVLAVITAKSGQRDSILRELRANMATVHAEKGCIEYAPAIDAEGIGAIQSPLGVDTFVVIEKWESIEALKAHAKASHMAAYGVRTKDMIASRVIHVLMPA